MSFDSPIPMPVPMPTGSASASASSVYAHGGPASGPSYAHTNPNRQSHGAISRTLSTSSSNASSPGLGHYRSQQGYTHAASHSHSHSPSPADFAHHPCTQASPTSHSHSHSHSNGGAHMYANANGQGQGHGIINRSRGSSTSSTGSISTNLFPAGAVGAQEDLPQDLHCKWGDCLYNAISADDLYDHLCADHVGRKSTNNLCLTCHWENCGVSCAKRDHITSHLRVHTNLKPHACSICSKQFKRPQDLKKHEKIHTEEHHAVHRHSKATMINAEGEAVQPPRYQSSSSKGYGKARVPLTGKTTMKVAHKSKVDFSSRRSTSATGMSESESETASINESGLGRKRNSDGDIVGRSRKNSDSGSSLASSMSPQQFPQYPLFPHYSSQHSQSQPQLQSSSLYPQLANDISLTHHRQRLETARLLEQHQEELMTLAGGHQSGLDLHRTMSASAATIGLHRTLSNNDAYIGSAHDAAVSSTRYGTSLPQDNSPLNQLFSDVKKRKVDPVYDMGMAARLDEIARTLAAAPLPSNFNYSSADHGTRPAASLSANAGGYSSSLSSNDIQPPSPWIQPSFEAPTFNSAEELANFNRFMLSLGQSADDKSSSNLFDANTLAQLELAGMQIPSAPITLPTKIEDHTGGSMYPSLALFDKSISPSTLFSNTNGHANGTANPNLNYSFDFLAKSKPSQAPARVDAPNFSQTMYRNHQLLGSAKPLSRPPPSSKSSLDVLTEVCEEELRRSTDTASDVSSETVAEPMEIDDGEASPPLPRGRITQLEANYQYKLPALRRPSVVTNFDDEIEIDPEEKTPVGLPPVAALLGEEPPPSRRTYHARLIRDILLSVNERFRKEGRL